MRRDHATSVLVFDDTTAWPHRNKQPLVVLPYYGEFGHFINSFIRQVHYLDAPEKIVCCRPGEEVYFPSATGFYYDWLEQFAPDDKVGYRDRWPPAAGFYPLGEELALIGRLRCKFPEHALAAMTQPLTTAQVIEMPVPITSPTVTFPRFDIVACCRRRRWDAYRNYEQWPEILAPLSERGFTIAVVGEASSSCDFGFVQFRSWTHSPPAEGVVLALSNARLYIGTDTGPTHLAALISPAILVFRNEECPYRNYISEVVSPVARRRAVPFCYLVSGWRNPEQVSQAASSFLGLGLFGPSGRNDRL